MATRARLTSGHESGATLAAIGRGPICLHHRPNCRPRAPVLDCLSGLAAAKNASLGAPPSQLIVFIAISARPPDHDSSANCPPPPLVRPQIAKSNMARECWRCAGRSLSCGRRSGQICWKSWNNGAEFRSRPSATLCSSGPKLHASSCGLAAGHCLAGLELAGDNN